MYYESFDSLKYGKGVERRYRCKYDERRSRRNEEWERKNIRENERVKKITGIRILRKRGHSFASDSLELFFDYY